MRGQESRAAFAARVGVSPLTVYRWELPDDAPEARRPRGQIAARLEALAGGVGVTTPERGGEAAVLAPDELAQLWPLIERLQRGELAAAEAGLLVALARGQARSPAARALGVQALARVALFARGDVRQAFTTLLPLLDALERDPLPPLVAFEVHVCAALVFGSLDGRFFDAGRTHAHAARAERFIDHALAPAEARFLLWHARLSAALMRASMLSDPGLLAVALGRADEVDGALASPLLNALAEEARAVASYLGQRVSEAAAQLERAAEIAAAHGLSYLEARLRAQLARQQIDEGAAPDSVLAALARVAALLDEARAPPSWIGLHVAYASSEAHLRLGDLARSSQAALGGVALAGELALTPGGLPLFLARNALLAGRPNEVRDVARALAAQPPGIWPELVARLGDAVAALAELAEAAHDGATAPALSRLDAAVAAIGKLGVWPYLLRNAKLALYGAAVLGDDDALAERTRRELRRLLDAHPSAWAGAIADLLSGLAALRARRPDESRAALARALATLELCGDRIGHALARHLAAALGGERGEREATAAALTALGVAFRGLLPAGEKHARRRGRAVSATVPVEAIARLTTRGLGATQLVRELVQVIEMVFAEARVALATGGEGDGDVHDVGQEAGGTRAIHVELGDGAGGRLRVSVLGELPAHAELVLEALGQVASLALERAPGRVSAQDEPPGESARGAPEVAGFVSASAVMRRLKADLARLSRSRATVIITGESGTGKEVVARAIHDLSARSAGPYVAFNCAAVPRELFEGQLFGYRRGAFTGASADHAGVIRAAEGGTLFLDEIGELPLEVQPKLLRFLENGEVFPLGAKAPINVDVRVIAATLRDLEEAVRERRFREDLYYRLQVVPIHVPPLRERPDDVIALARHFLERLAGADAAVPALGPDALDALTRHTWPGNARELRNIIERALAFEPRPSVLGAAHLKLGAGLGGRRSGRTAG